MIAPVNDNRHMISHDANMICGHLNKLQAYMDVAGDNCAGLLQVEYHTLAIINLGSTNI